jgi:hypothetical protein
MTKKYVISVLDTRNERLVVKWVQTYGVGEYQHFTADVGRRSAYKFSSESEAMREAGAIAKKNRNYQVGQAIECNG